jgi:uncharacterized protein (DUF1330 family)
MAELGEMLARNPDEPIVMLNLNTYRDRDEYMRYGDVAMRVLARIGGRILWHSETKTTLIGDESDDCDEVIAVSYPSLRAFVEFTQDPEIVAALPHRAAGLERAALVCCSPGINGFPDV